jgi:hypothetical protein
MQTNQIALSASILLSFSLTSIQATPLIPQSFGHNLGFSASYQNRIDQQGLPDFGLSGNWNWYEGLGKGETPLKTGFLTTGFTADFHTSYAFLEGRIGVQPFPHLILGTAFRQINPWLQSSFPMNNDSLQQNWNHGAVFDNVELQSYPYFQIALFDLRLYHQAPTWNASLIYEHAFVDGKGGEDQYYFDQKSLLPLINSDEWLRLGFEFAKAVHPNWWVAFEQDFWITQPQRSLFQNGEFWNPPEGGGVARRPTTLGLRHKIGLKQFQADIILDQHSERNTVFCADCILLKLSFKHPFFWGVCQNPSPDK